ncbi:pyridoxamine 5'-phosphate oxidase family protein [Planotetraspora kaengkrachanensis]|uniref:Pyridoxamine 5'-phosphate oxidase n=1 Tax=Planotetraspora kaengkrachanensis TaxID=575193 RepID=A0A8J3LXP6_9ACTN|nr:pyridoxamine 5'-phosphate oxidase family protein [Planotetraspora kaengkrachanensis]GIG78635.1 pyridoxamine 5'-phosphate oxidase [Planotetraspora kaengkrachanensis]
MALLASARVGRIVYTDRALPAVQPVNFHLHGERIVILTSSGSKLSTAVANAVVAFETDEYDVETRTGWSVTAVGRSRTAHEPDEAAALARLPLTPWGPGRDHYIVVEVQQLSGRRVPR